MNTTHISKRPLGSTVIFKSERSLETKTFDECYRRLTSVQVKGSCPMSAAKAFAILGTCTSQLMMRDGGIPR